jgi:hypothetical protein
MAIADKEIEAVSSGKRKEIIRRLFGKKEKFPVIEIPTVPEVPPEVERKLKPAPGPAVQLTKPVVDDQTGQVLVTSAAAQVPKIVLPLTKEEIEKGLHYKIFYSIRWLAEWCLRLIKRVGRRTRKRS